MSELFSTWCQRNRQNIYTNGRGTTFLVNFPIELERELHALPFASGLFDLAESGVFIRTTDLPVKLSSNASKLSQYDRSNIRQALDNGETTVALAAVYGVSRVTISRIKNGHLK